MNDTLQAWMREATRLTQAGRLHEATAAIQRALGNTGAVPNPIPPHAQATARRATHWVAGPKALPRGLDGCVFELEAGLQAPAPTTAPTPDRVGRGEFTRGRHTNGSLTRDYKLYTPPGHAGRSLPLVVMLHGCTQDPDDFAAGTGMNERAREQGFFVLYPAQSQDANPSRCWNWFKHNHQRRGSGEPALLASMTQSVMQQHDIDPRRVYIAGLSAGGAMAAIVAEAYPELFAAVGVHSGLPRGAASSMPEALAVMQGGWPEPGLAGPAPAAAVPPRTAVPTIVFHGDQDRTVHPRNGEQVIAAVLGAAGTGPWPAPAGSPRVEQGVSSQGLRYTRSTHAGGNGNALAEHWVVHGAGHAWSGGQAAGSYTDARGPDATGEMLRFFFGQCPSR